MVYRIISEVLTSEIIVIFQTVSIFCILSPPRHELAFSRLCRFNWSSSTPQLQLSLESPLAECTITGFEIGEALVVVGFNGFDFFNNC